MNAVIALVVAVLFYPGVLAALVATWALGWTREAVRAAVGSGQLPRPLAALTELRAALGREAQAPVGVQPALLAVAPLVALAAPLAVLLLLPIPGNPLVEALGLRGDLVVGGALLLGVPLARLLVGWAIPSPYGRLAADRGARLLAGFVLPAALALAALAQQTNTFQLAAADAPARAPLPAFALLARLLAAAAFACCLPALTRGTALREGEGDLEVIAGELTDLSGRDLASFRVAEGLQLVAASGFFVAAFVLPVLVSVLTSQRALLWLIAVVASVAGIGAWDGVRASRLPATEKPPLSWWLGLPLLLALLALVLAAWAARFS